MADPQEANSATMLVAVIEDEPDIRSYMVEAVQRRGHRTIEAADGFSGLDLIRNEEPDLVFLDIMLPGISGLAVLRSIREERLDPIVVINTAYGSEDAAIEALRLRANDYLKKPVRLVELTGVLDKYQPVVAARRAPTALPDFVVSKRCHVRLENDLSIVAVAAEYLTAEGELGRWRDGTLGCTLGLMELIINAIEHGNLGITGPEKLRCLATAGDAYGGLLRERAAEPDRRQRSVHIELISTREQSEWIIADQGDGFDWQTVLQGLGAFDTIDVHGRGIFLACASFDQVEYNEIGNTVRAVKLKRPVT